MVAEFDVQDEAIKVVIQYEKGEHRIPENVSKSRIGYDISSGDRQIEVKGRSTANFVWLNDWNIKALEKEPNFWLYIVRFDGNKLPIKIKKFKQLDKNKINDNKISELRQWGIKF